MPIDVGPLWDAVVLLAEQEEWKLTVGYTAGTAVANVVGGLAGMLIHGQLGSMIGVGITAVSSYWYTKNRYKPIYVILKEDLTPNEQEELIRLLREAFRDFTIQDVMIIAKLMLDKREIGMKVKDVVFKYLTARFLEQAKEQTQYERRKQHPRSRAL